MKTIKNKHLKLSFVISVSSLVLAIFIIGSVFAYHLNSQTITQSSDPTGAEEPNINYDKPTNEQIQAAELQKEASINSDGKLEADPFSVTITSLNQDLESSTLRIRTLISRVVNSGNCTLTMSTGSSVITRAVNVQTGPASSTCMGYDILFSELTNDTWKIKIEVSADGLVEIVEREIQINAV